MTVFDIHNRIETALSGGIEQYAMYLRKSRADRDATDETVEETLARHKQILTDLAVRKGIYIGEIYEEVVSGETIQARPEIQRLIKDCYAGKWRGILIVEVTRLSRGNQGDAQVIMDCLKYSNQNNGILVVTPTKIYDVANNSDDEEYMEFELFMSRREYKMIKKRMDRGKKQAVVEGNYMGAYRPYGYDILKSKKTRTLIENPEEGPIVRLIFEWTVKKNMTPGKIARKLTAMGVPTYSGEPEWNIATIKTILTNPVYIGKVRWNDRMQVKTLVNGELVVSRPRSNHTEHYMLYDGKHTGLVDEETFKDASSRFYSDKTKGGLKLINPLAGILVCQSCQKAMAYQAYKGRATAPRYHHTQSQICKVKSVVADDVMNAVAHALKLYIEDFQVKIDNLPDVDENTILDQMTALREEQYKVEKKLSKLFDSWEDGLISNNEFVQRKEVNNQRIEAIKQQMDELEASIPEKEEYQEKIMKLADALDALLDEELDADIKNEYLKLAIEKIEFSRENKEEFILDVFLRES